MSQFHLKICGALKGIAMHIVTTFNREFIRNTENKINNKLDKETIMLKCSVSVVLKLQHDVTKKKKKKFTFTKSMRF